MYKKLIQMLAEAKTRDDINKVCGAVDRAYQSDKITFKDNEQLYALIGDKSRKIALVDAILARQSLIEECVASARESKDEHQVDMLFARHSELQGVIDYINKNW